MILMRPDEVDAELGIPRETVYYWMRRRMVRRHVGADGKLRVERAEVKALRAKRSHLARRPSRSPD